VQTIALFSVRVYAETTDSRGTRAFPSIEKPMVVCNGRGGNNRQAFLPTFLILITKIWIFDERPIAASPDFSLVVESAPTYAMKNAWPPALESIARLALIAASYIRLHAQRKASIPRLKEGSSRSILVFSVVFAVQKLRTRNSLLYVKLHFYNTFLQCISTVG
jgi:hypothetical protein